MSFFPQALALLPAAAAIGVIVAALADRRDTARLNSLRDLDLALVELERPSEHLETSAA
jgi:hypothetical protein